MSKVVQRKVTRYYVKGKGYSTRRAAYMVLAKQMLFDLVLGPVHEVPAELREEYDEMDPVCYAGRRNLLGCHESEIKDKIDELFARAFPHADCEGSVRPGCMSADPSDACVCAQTPQGAFRFTSCKWSQGRWLQEAVNRLMDEEVSI